MFTITLRRTAATLAVAAGLLAAAGPASAQLPPSASGVTKAPGTQPASALHLEEMSMGIAEGRGTQVGSEGVKAPTNATPRTPLISNGAADDVMNLNDIEAIDLNTLGGANENVLDTGMLEHEWLKAPAADRGILIGDGLTHEGGFVKAPTNAGTQIGSEG